MKIEIENQGKHHFEDSKQASIIEIEDPKSNCFVRFQSWDADKEHPELSPFIGKKLKVTIEIIE